VIVEEEEGIAIAIVIVIVMGVFVKNICSWWFLFLLLVEGHWILSSPKKKQTPAIAVYPGSIQN
jgi:hypothetical protein